MPRAVLSVSDKRGLIEFGRELTSLGWEIVSTGGTASALGDAGVPVRGISDVTGHPEIMDGRVKTLHPAVHAGILARRDRADDLAELERNGYAPIDLVAVNLYPFREAVAAGAVMDAAMEQVDIGGPTMLRAAAKNHAHVLAVVDPDDYPRMLSALRAGEIDAMTRAELARKVFAHTAAYDAAIADYLAGRAEASVRRGSVLPSAIELRLTKVQDLRYGENPDQPAAFYSEEDGPPYGLPTLRQLHGKELSFNNLLDLDAARFAVSAWQGPQERTACVIIKHTTPCGVALGDDAEAAYTGARATDPVSAFGGVVGFNRAVDAAAAEAMADVFLEAVLAPAFDDDALEILRRKKNLRLIELAIEAGEDPGWDVKRVRGGFLFQRATYMRFPETDWRVVTRREPEPAEWAGLRFAWRVAAAVKSNAIVLAADERTLGIGAGQMSRVDASRLAVLKATDQNFNLRNAALASDAFFPFRDGVDAAAEAGVRTIVQPGGSIRDEEVIAAADEHGLAMVFTGRRLFRH